MSGPIATYLDELDDVLAFDPALSRRVRDEIESHLYETAENVGEANAVLRFGRPAEIARAYAAAALPDRLRRSCIAAVLLGSVTLMLMRVRTLFLDIPAGRDPLAWLDRGGLTAALACMAAAWWIAPRDQIESVRFWLHLAVGSLGLSVASSLMRAFQSATGGSAVALIAATALVELLLLGVLLTELARLDRYARRLTLGSD